MNADDERRILAMTLLRQQIKIDSLTEALNKVLGVVVEQQKAIQQITDILVVSGVTKRHDGMMNA